jgi:AP-1 complex subunit sigma 1/2
MVLARAPKLCNFLEWKDKKVIYKRFVLLSASFLMSIVCVVTRYASLFFIACVDNTDNELITLEKIHLFVEILDRYFGNVIPSYPPMSFLSSLGL